MKKITEKKMKKITEKKMKKNNQHNFDFQILFFEFDFISNLTLYAGFGKMCNFVH